MASSTAGVRTRTSTGSVRHVRNKEAWHEAGIFLKNFVRHPLMLGSVIPSSRYLINRVLDNIDWQQTRTGVEYGPGVGTFTRPILGRMRADARLLAIELNADFGQLLRSSINDGRLCVADGSAADVREWMYSFELAKADFILSGIPFTVLPKPLRMKILMSTLDALSPDGIFCVYQYTRAVLPELREVFSSVEEDFEPLNILPARVFICRK